MRTSASQFELLVEFMEKHGDLSKITEGPYGRIRNLNLWAELTTALNADGSGDQKTAEKWRKVWSDQKNNTKRKAARAHRAAVGTGGGPASKIKLTHLEERILNIIGREAAVGVSGVVEIGINQENLSNEESGVSRSTAAVEQGASIELSQDWRQSQASSSTAPWVQPAAAVPPASLTPPAREHPASPPLSSTPPPPTSQASPLRRRLTARRRTQWQISPRTSRPATQSELARIQFSRSDTEWRELQKEKEKHAYELEKERLRLREIELQQQAKWQELFAQFLSIMSEVANKYLNK